MNKVYTSQGSRDFSKNLDDLMERWRGKYRKTGVDLTQVDLQIKSLNALKVELSALQKNINKQIEKANKSNASTCLEKILEMGYSVEILKYANSYSTHYWMSTTSERTKSNMVFTSTARKLEGALNIAINSLPNLKAKE